MGRWSKWRKDSTAVTMHMLETLESFPPILEGRSYVTCKHSQKLPVIDHVHNFIEALRYMSRQRPSC